MDELKPGESAYIETVGGSGALRHHLLDMGLTPDAEITLQKVAPMGDPVQFEVRGYELTLRLEEARKVTVKNVHKKDSPLKAADQDEMTRLTPASENLPNTRSCI